MSWFTSSKLSSLLPPRGCRQDSFFRRFKGSPFPEAIEANGSELAAVTQKVAVVSSH